MRHESRLLLAVLVIAAWPATGQQTPAPPPQVPTPPAHEGFFRPAEDPSLTRSPQTPPAVPDQGMTDSAVSAANAAAFAASAAREAALERELDRAQREDERARAEAAARQPPPMIVSPLDGTAPIVSPLGR